MTFTTWILVFAVLYSTNSHGRVYRCTGANGRVLYSDTACDTQDDRQAVELAPIPDAPANSSFFSAITEKIRGFIARFANDRPSSARITDAPLAEQQPYRCDGRTRCSQMTSCDEAIFYITHCPNTEMDGDNDGVPCESQWCGK